MEIDVADYGVVVEVPDDMDPIQARDLINRKYPPKGKPVASGFAPPSWVPKQEEAPPIESMTEDLNRMGQSMVYANMFNLDGQTALAHHDEIHKEVGPRIAQAVKSGLQSSVPGLAFTQKLPTFEAAGSVEEILQGFGQLAGDLPVMIAGSFIGGGPESPLGWGAAFALPAGIRKVYIDKIQRGEVQSFGDFFDRLSGAVKETLKGEVTGIATGYARKLAPMKLKTASEIATMTTVGSLLEGKIPEPKDFIHAAVLVGGLKLSFKAIPPVVNRFQEIYKKHGVRPEEVAHKVQEELTETNLRPLSDILEDVDVIEKPEPVGKFTATEAGAVRTEPSDAEILSVIDRYRERQIEEAFRTTEEVPKPKIEGPSESADLEAQAGRVDRKEYEKAIRKLLEKDRNRAIQEWNEGQQLEAVGDILSAFEKQLAERTEVTAKGDSATTPSVTKGPGKADITAAEPPKAEGGIKEISSIEDLKSFTDEKPGLFVRWSISPKSDIKQRFSVDKVSGQSHAGLSAVEIEPGWSPGKLSRRVKEYGFLRMNDPNVKAWLYEGKRVGTDSDGYPVIEIKKAVGRLSDSLVSDLDSGVGKRLELQERIAEETAALARTNDQIGKQIVQKSIDKLNKELSELPNPSRPPESGGLAPASGGQPPAIEHRAAREIFDDISTLLTDSGTTLGSLFGPMQRLYEVAAGIDLTPAERAARTRLINDMKVASESAKRQGIELKAYLVKQGMDPATVDKMMLFAPQPKMPASEFSEEDPVIKQRSIGKKTEERFAPALRESDRSGVESIGDIGNKWYGLTNPLYVFDRMGKWAKDNIYHPMKEAEDAAKRDFLRIKNEIDPVKSALPKAAADRIGTYAIAQQSKGMKILEHMGIEKVPELTPQEMDAYNLMRGNLEDLYNRLQAARALAGKEPFGKVENYFTFFHEVSILDQMGLNPIFGKTSVFEKTMDNLKSDFIHRKATAFGFAKKRNNGAYPVDLNAFRIYEKYADSATVHIAKSPVIAKSRELLLKFPDGYQLIDEKPYVHKWLTSWLDFQAGQAPTRPEWLPEFADKAIGKLNKNLAFAILSANLRSALIQPTSLLSTVTEIGVKHTKEGIGQLFDDARVKFAMDNSKVLLSREFDINVTEAMRGIGGKAIELKQWAGEKGLAPLKYLDMKAATATWLGAFEKAKAEGIENPARYADEVVTRTQASAQKSDLAPMQRTNIGKALTLFQTFVINQWNWLVKDVAGINNPNIEKAEAFKKFSTYVVGATMINILFEDIMGINSPFPSPINVFVDSVEKGDGLLAASTKAALELSTFAPMLGGMRYGETPLGATASYINDVTKAIAQRHDARPALELVGKGLGIPGTTQASKIMKAETAGEALLGKKPK